MKAGLPNSKVVEGKAADCGHLNEVI